jgi:hypothetical protein
MEPMGWFHVVLNILVAGFTHFLKNQPYPTISNHIQPYPTIITTHRTDFSMTSQGLWHVLAKWVTEKNAQRT